ncbi:MAG: hypothetical protein KGI69_00075 [Patescibacteria group bacterium]|nr:hypothetical protein [Patescibacteria group bacterium]
MNDELSAGNSGPAEDGAGFPRLAPAPSPEPDDTERDGRVFDISPDLNISLVDDSRTAEPSAAPKPATPPKPPRPPLSPVPPPSAKAPIPPPKPPAPAAKPAEASQAAAPAQTDWPFAFKGYDVRTNEKQVRPAASLGKLTAPTPSASEPLEMKAPPEMKEQPSSAPIRVPNPPPKQPAQPKPLSKSAAPSAPEGMAGSESDLRPLRTYESDVAEVLAQRKASAASIVIAENKKASGEERLGSSEPTGGGHAGIKSAIALISLVFIGTGIIGGYYLYSKSPLAATSVPVASPSATPTLVPADSQATVSIDGLAPNGILAKIQAEASAARPPNSIEQIIPVSGTGRSEQAVSAQDMLTAMNIPAPDMLVRTLAPEWMLGVYTDGSGARSAFVVVKTDFFQNAFAGMLQWESTMADDLKHYVYHGAPIYDIATQQGSPAAAAAPASSSPISALPMSTTTATTTALASSTAPTSASSTASTTQQTNQTVPIFSTIQGSFKDEVIKNKDVRAYVSSQGQTLFVYSFIDQSTLVMAGSDAALGEVISRIENAAFVR